MAAELVTRLKQNLNGKLGDKELEDYLRQKGITDDELIILWEEKRKILKEGNNG